MKHRIIALAVFLFCCISLQAAPGNYYIDFVGGLDSNPGTSISQPWQRHPRMTGFAGSYTHVAGDKFFFKGGVTWPRAVFPINLENFSGGAGPGAARDYYGVDKTWFNGGAFTRPIFDAQDAELPGANRFFNLGGFCNNVHIDNFIFTRFFWSGASVFSADVMVNVSTSTNVLVSNCLFTNWSHATFSQQSLDADPNGTRSRGLVCIEGHSNPPRNNGSAISNCVFDSGMRMADPGGDAVYLMPHIWNSVAKNACNGFLVNGGGGSCSVTGCVVGPLIAPNDGGATHDNLIESVAADSTRFVMANNILTNGGSIWTFLGGFGAGYTAVVYNNLIYSGGGLDRAPIDIDAISQNGQGGGTFFIWNNTFVTSNNLCVKINSRDHPLARIDKLVIQNNHCISPLAASFGTVGSVPITVLTNSFNITHTPSVAASLGYTLANKYAPGPSSVTVNAGNSNIAASVFLDALNGVRNQGAWDIGAWEYGATGGPVDPPTGTPDNAPPVILAFVATNLLHNSALIELAWNEPATNTIVWGPTTSYGFTNTSTERLETHAFVITNLGANSLYHWAFRGRDLSNNVSEISPDQTFTTAPIISNLFRIQAESGSKYHIEETTVGTNTYIFQDVDSGGLTNTSGRLTFALYIPTNGDYTITAFVDMPHDTSNSWFLNFNVPPTAPFHTWDLTNFTTGFELRDVSHRGSGNFTNNQFKPLTNMLMVGTNILYWAGREADGKLDYFRLNLLSAPPPDTNGPVITNVFASNISAHGAHINWTTIDEAANGAVDYGTSGPSGTTVSDPVFFPLDHDIFIGDLQPLTTYFYRVRSCDPSGNCTTNGPHTLFTTAEVVVTRRLGGSISLKGKAAFK